MNKRILLTIFFAWSIFITAFSWHITKKYFPRMTYEVKTEQIDSTQWVSVAQYETQRNLYNDLSKEFTQKIKDSDMKIFSLSNLTGRLRLNNDNLKKTIDSLKFLNGFTIADSLPLVESDLEIINNKITDTTITTSNTFGDSLIMVNSKVDIKDNTMTNEIDLVQLRDINIQITSTVSDDQSTVISYISSTDFKELNITNKTTLKQKRSFYWFWIGLSTGMVTTIAILKL